MNIQQKGKFIISQAIFRADLDIALAILSKVVVLRAESLYAADCIQYIGVCADFDRIDPGDIIPEYTPFYDSVSGKVHFERGRP